MSPSEPPTFADVVDAVLIAASRLVRYLATYEARRSPDPTFDVFGGEEPEDGAEAGDAAPTDAARRGNRPRR